MERRVEIIENLAVSGCPICRGTLRVAPGEIVRVGAAGARGERRAKGDELINHRAVGQDEVISSRAEGGSSASAADFRHGPNPHLGLIERIGLRRTAGGGQEEAQFFEMVVVELIRARGKHVGRSRRDGPALLITKDRLVHGRVKSIGIWNDTSRTRGDPVALRRDCAHHGPPPCISRGKLQKILKGCCSRCAEEGL